MINMSLPIIPTRGQAASKRKNKIPKSTMVKKKKAAKEMTKLGAMLRYLGAGAGTTLGGYAGYPVQGGSIGYGLGAALSKWLGSGDYRVSANSLTQGNIPAMHSTSQSVVVRHKEFVGEIVGSQVFKVQQSVVLNPGLAQSFPWLSAIASAYSEYRIRGMVFHYVPSSGNSVGSTNTALGTVMFQTTYRSSDNIPTSKSELLNEYCSNETVPSETLCHPIECDPRENPFKIQYVRGVSPPAGDSTLLYDLGTTHIATSGMQVDNKVIGDVWVTYEVEFKKPVVSSNVVNSDSQAFTFNPSTITNMFTTMTNMPGGTVTSPADNVLSFTAVNGRAYSVVLYFKFGNPANATFQQTAVVASGGTLFTPSTGNPLLPVNWTAQSTLWAGTGLNSGNGASSFLNVRASSNTVTLTYTFTGSNLGTMGTYYSYGWIVENTF
jgi:hypothetical protein